MPVRSGGDAANDNRSTGTADPLRLDLAPKPWSGTAPAAETVAWIEDAWCTPASRPMPTGPD